MIPDDLVYSPDHEWVRGTSGTVRIGITDYAQKALGDIVYVQFPELGATIAAGDSVGEVESTKSVSEIFTPLSGTVSAVNEDLESSPELINSDPYGAGWIYELDITDSGAIADLLDAEGYAAITAE